MLEGSLGYYINPLIVFLFAAMFFGERFRPLQLLAVGIAAAGVLNQTLVVGEFPWVSLSLAFSFAIYGAIRKTTKVDSRIGFGLEALWLFLPALAYLVFFLPPGVAVFGSGEPGFIALLLLAGPLTATPLILFAMGARRLRMSTIGVLQFIAPNGSAVHRHRHGRALHPRPRRHLRTDLDGRPDLHPRRAPAAPRRRHWRTDKKNPRRDGPAGIS